LESFYREHDPVLLTVGLLELEYDLPLQVNTLGKIREYLPGAGLVIIGAGSLEADLRRAIGAVPWAEHILLAGDVPHAVTLKATAEAAMLLRTTLYDGDSVSVREALRHRGPDDFGYHVDSYAALGHRRLSIIDLAAGHQPMTNEDGSLWITYNGEIFNHAEIRPELERAGHRYATRSDTETVIHA